MHSRHKRLVISLFLVNTAHPRPMPRLRCSFLVLMLPPPTLIPLPFAPPARLANEKPIRTSYPSFTRWREKV